MHECSLMISLYCISSEDLLLHASFRCSSKSNVTALELIPVCLCTAVLYVPNSDKLYCKVGIIIIANCYFVYVLVIRIHKT